MKTDLDNPPESWRPAAAPAALALLTLLLLALAGCGDADGQERGEDEEPRATPAVEVLEARAGGLPLEEELSGVVRARNQVAIRPEISATVASVLVRSGDRVERGQPLVRLDAAGLEDQSLQAEAALRMARANAAEARAGVAEVNARASRTQALHDEGLVSDMELETQQAQLAAARAQAEQAEAQVAEAQAALQERQTATDKTVVRAPVAGRVGQRNAEVGMVVDPSTTLFLVGDFDELIVEVPLTEAMLGYIEEGTPVRIHAASLGEEPLPAAISRISPFLEQGSFSTSAEIDVDNPGGRLRPGMFVAVDVLYGQSDRATLVPASSLWEDPDTGDLGIYVLAGDPELAAEVRNGDAISADAHPFELRPVTVLAEGEAMAGVQGIRPGEWVVTVGQQLLHDAAQSGGRGQGAGGQDRDREGPGGPPGGEAGGPVVARVRGADWDQVLALQRLQREDLLQSFLEKQRAVARSLGAEIPEDPEAVDEVTGGRGNGSGSGG